MKRLIFEVVMTFIGCFSIDFLLSQYTDVSLVDFILICAGVCVFRIADYIGTDLTKQN